MSSTEPSTEHLRCPHCHSVAEPSPSPEARFVCSVCGGARIVIDDKTIEASPETIEALRIATVALRAHANWRLLATVAAPFGLVSVLVLWLAIGSV